MTFLASGGIASAENILRRFKIAAADARYAALSFGDVRRIDCEAPGFCRAGAGFGFAWAGASYIRGGFRFAAEAPSSIARVSAFSAVLFFLINFSYRFAPSVRFMLSVFPHRKVDVGQIGA